MVYLSHEIKEISNYIDRYDYDYDDDDEIDLFGHIILRKYITMNCIIYKI